MEKFQEVLKGLLIPIAEKVERQKHIQAIKDGMLSITPIIIVGSISLLFIAFSNMLPQGGLKDFITSNMDAVFMYPFNFTMGLISVYSAFFIAQSLAKKYDLNHIQIGITSVIIQFLICAEIVDGAMKITYLDAQGLFISIIVAIIVVEITRIMNEKNIVLRFPKEVPVMVSKSFNNLIPTIVCIIIGTGIVVLTNTYIGKPIPQIIMDFLAPAINSLDNVWAVMLILFITQLLWFFGLHGAAITSSIWMPIAANYMAENAALIAAGGEPTRIFTIGFYYSFLQVTGSGITLGLVIMMARSKCKSLNSIGKLSLVPSLFGINEPVIFGAPLVMNPYMFIPFVFGPVFIGAMNFLAVSSGIVGKAIAEPPGFLPPGVAAFLMTMDFKAIIMVFISIALMSLIYYPFFKIMEKEEMKKQDIEQEDDFDLSEGFDL